METNIEHEHPLLLGDTLTVICQYLSIVTMINLSQTCRSTTSFFQAGYGRKYFDDLRKMYPKVNNVLEFSHLLPPQSGLMVRKLDLGSLVYDDDIKFLGEELKIKTKQESWVGGTGGIISFVTFKGKLMTDKFDPKRKSQEWIYRGRRKELSVNSCIMKVRKSIDPEFEIKLRTLNDRIEGKVFSMDCVVKSRHFVLYKSEYECGRMEAQHDLEFVLDKYLPEKYREKRESFWDMMRKGRK